MDKALSMLGIAARAGKVKSGQFACEQAIKSGNAYLLILAEDASNNTKKSFINACNFYGVKYIQNWNMESLGHAIGKEFRATAAVCDEGLARSIMDKI